MSEEYGPKTPFGKWVYDTKHLRGASFKDGMTRVANELKDNDEHFFSFRDILYNQKFLPGGRILAAVGSTELLTPYNCYVMDTIPDSREGIHRVLGEAMETMAMGGGVGYDFSTLRPRGAHIVKLNSVSSGPINFMDVFDAMCSTISSAGHRRGAQMGVLRVDHPDIEEFIDAKRNAHKLRNFNISVAITDEFMQAVKSGSPFSLRWGGQTYRTVDAKALWNKIMRSTWEYADPGVLFIDRINAKNNLHYCETIAATNPCGEQPLPPYGACLLGSINLVKYVEFDAWAGPFFNTEQLIQDIPHIHRAMDNVVDRALYPLPQQEREAKDKRRMGIGITGLANAAEMVDKPYGSEEMKDFTRHIMTVIRDTLYRSSIAMAIEKGPFPLFSPQLLNSEFAKTLPDGIREDIAKHGLRNSHLLSIAPTGTISIGADNVSSGIEPPFSLQYDRKVVTFDGTSVETVKDYAFREHGIEGRTAQDISVDDHVDILNLVSYYVDSACSKTCNEGPDVTWDQHLDVYMKAYKGGASGCTTYRAREGLESVLSVSKDEPKKEEESQSFEADGAACVFDPETGVRSCE